MKYLYLVLSFFILKSVYAEKVLSIPYRVTATFGEYRGRHFHGGVDIATRGVTGYPVFAWDKGYISRLKRSTKGTGNTIYLKHGNGDTTVYAHLEDFSSKIDSIYPPGRYGNHFPKEIIWVKAGELIGYSGESGNGVPHLHFELRKGSKPNSSVVKALGIKDTVPPLIQKVSLVSFKTEKNSPVPVSQGEAFSVSGQRVIQVEGYDRVNNSGARCHIPHWKLFIDDELYWEYFQREFSFTGGETPMEIFDFAKTGFNPTRYTFKLYRDYLWQNSSIQKEKNYGVLPSGAHHVRIEACDFMNNCSNFHFSYKNPDEIKPSLFPYSGPLHFSNGDFRLNLKADSVSSSAVLTLALMDCESGENRGFMVSPDSIFFRSSAEVQYFTDDEKMYPSSYSDYDGKWESLDYEFRGRMLRFYLPSPGAVCINVDKERPWISTVLEKHGGSRFKWNVVSVADRQSGIDEKSLKISCNGKPLLGEYDMDHDWIRFRESCKNPVVFLCDKAKNCNTQQATLKP
jgi:murein DD-endopeptidase MepM/ murein hydrolase activator NlpD